MPQLDHLIFTSQLIWLFLALYLLYYILAFTILPFVFELKKNKIKLFNKNLVSGNSVTFIKSYQNYFNIILNKITNLNINVVKTKVLVFIYFLTIVYLIQDKSN